MEENYPKPLEELIHQLSSLPGIGRKTAMRLAIHITRISEEEALNISRAIDDVKKNIRFCKNCFNISSNDRCQICTDPKRDSSTICVVEDFTDIYSIERTGEFKGLYHVLGGVISPLEGRSPADLTIDKLVARIDSGTKELILAVNPSSEGEVTILYISKILFDKPVKLTYLARGIPVGTSLEYLDQVTLGRALEGRRELLR